MRRLLELLVIMLAINFLALAGAVGWLWQTGALDRQKIDAIREVLYPQPAPAEPVVLAEEPGALPDPGVQLDELLARHAGRPAAEQVQFIRQSFDAQMAQLQRAQRELVDLQRQVELAQQQLTRDRAQLVQQQERFETQRREQRRLAEDQGFQDALALYQSLPARQVKSIFMELDEPTVVRYLQAMDNRAAARITREFRTPAELERLSVYLEMMRQNAVSAVER